MSSCEYYALQLSSFFDDALSPEDERALLEHLRVCPQCRQTYRLFRGLSATLQKDAADPPADLTDRIMQRVRAAGPPQQAPPPVRRPAVQPSMEEAAPVRKKKHSHWIPVGVMAACLALVIGVAALRNTGRSDRLPPEDPPVSIRTPDAVPKPAPAPVPDPADAPVLGAYPDCVLLMLPEADTPPASADGPLEISDPAVIRSLQKLLLRETETDPVPDGLAPVCTLQDTDENGDRHTCTIWILGQDAVFRSGDASPYYKIENGAEALQELLQLPRS